MVRPIITQYNIEDIFDMSLYKFTTTGPAICLLLSMASQSFICSALMYQGTTFMKYNI